MPDTLLPLDLLRTGETATVEDVHGEPGWVSRLAEMGLRVGCVVRMLRAGSPCMLQVGEGRLCLRCDQTACVLVRMG